MLVRHPLSPYWEKCGAMGCGILYRIMAEQFGLCATLATRRTAKNVERVICEYVDGYNNSAKKTTFLQLGFLPHIS
jgi:hypothetical protein